MNLATKFRWWIWEWASRLTYWICPDKKALDLVLRDGWVQTKRSLEKSRRAALQEVQE